MLFKQMQFHIKPDLVLYVGQNKQDKVGRSSNCTLILLLSSPSSFLVTDVTEITHLDDKDELLEMGCKFAGAKLLVL